MATTPEQRLFNQITRLTLLLGILIGMWVVFAGVIIYDFFLASREGYHIVAHDVDDLLLPLTSFLVGIIWVLQWKVQSMRSRLPVLRPSASDTASGRYFGLLGLLMISLCSLVLIERVVSLPDVVELILSVGGFIALGLIFGSALYREFRRVAQR